MKQKWIPALLAVFCLMGGCAETSTGETAATQPETMAETSAAATEAESAAETTQIIETDIPTQSATEFVTQPLETDAPTQSLTEDAEMETEATQVEESFHADMQVFSAPAYACQIEVPTGWMAYEGASDGNINSEISVFQPEVPNGDSISLMVADAEDPDTFAAMTQEDIAAAYAQSLSSVTVTEMEPITISACPAYRISVRGEVSGVTVEIAQLLMNCTDAAYGNYLYSLTYTNASGEAPVYTDAVESYFHFT